MSGCCGLYAVCQQSPSYGCGSWHKCCRDGWARGVNLPCCVVTAPEILRYNQLATTAIIAGLVVLCIYLVNKWRHQKIEGNAPKDLKAKE